jgi:hypothetical protein
VLSSHNHVYSNFPIGEPWTKPFVALLNGEREEIILREKEQLNRIGTAVEEAKSLGADGEELTKLTQLKGALFRKIDLPGTKAQLKPVYSKRQAGHVRTLTKLTLVFKWGGEFTHSARYQSRDLGENMKKDISIMSKRSPYPSSTTLTNFLANRQGSTPEYKGNDFCLHFIGQSNTTFSRYILRRRGVSSRPQRFLRHPLPRRLNITIPSPPLAPVRIHSLHGHRLMVEVTATPMGPPMGLALISNSPPTPTS